MSETKKSTFKQRMMGYWMAAGLLTVPAVVAFAEVRSTAGFSLFSTVGATDPHRLSVQERARKQLMRVKENSVRVAADEDTVSTETPTTMIAQYEVASEIDEDSLFPIMLAAPAH